MTRIYAGERPRSETTVRVSEGMQKLTNSEFSVELGMKMERNSVRCAWWNKLLKKVFFLEEITSPVYTQQLDESQLEVHLRRIEREKRISPPKRPMALQPVFLSLLWKTDIRWKRCLWHISLPPIHIWTTTTMQSVQKRRNVVGNSILQAALGVHPFVFVSFPTPVHS